MTRPKHLLQAGFVAVGVAGAILGTVYVGIAITRGQSRSDQNAHVCRAAHSAVHEAIIRQGQVMPQHITAPQCDTLTILNLDPTVRLLAFGEHESHQTYDGIGEKVLKQGQKLTITLVQPGDFKFHDHIHDEVQGTFRVTPAN